MRWGSSPFSRLTVCRDAFFKKSSKPTSRSLRELKEVPVVFHALIRVRQRAEDAWVEMKPFATTLVMVRYPCFLETGLPC